MHCTLDIESNQQLEEEVVAANEKYEWLLEGTEVYICMHDDNITLKTVECTIHHTCACNKVICLICKNDMPTYIPNF